MSSVISTPSVPAAKRRAVPPLVNGDRLTRKEFERRYFAMPQTTRAELIEGIVYITPSPVRYEAHGKPQAILAAWVGYYVAKTQGLSGFGDNATVRLNNDNEPQPDLFLMLPSSAGGIAKVDADLPEIFVLLDRSTSLPEHADFVKRLVTA